MRTLLISTLLLSACTSPDSDPPYDPAALAGSWTGTATNDQTTRYTFGPGSSFSYGRVADTGTYTPFLTGTYTIDLHDLVLTTAVPNENGTAEPMMIQMSAYLGATQFCDAALRPEPGNEGLIGMWTSATTSSHLDAAGQLTDGTTASDSITLAADGTFEDQAGSFGTYSVTGEMVTTTIAHGNVSAVRSYNFVDGAVLCDPTYTH